MNISFLDLLAEHLVPVIGLAVGLAIYFLLLKLLFPLLGRLAQKWSRPYLGVIFTAFRQPVSYLVLVGAAYFAVTTSPLALFESEKTMLFCTRAANVLCVLLIAWGFWRCSSLIPPMVAQVRGKLELGTSKALSQFLRRIAQALIAFLGAVMILSILGYNVNALVAGLGIGGLTIALAAQDAASNFFGGFTIITDHPFEIGDWVSVLGVEGTVEDITLRSTKIRTLENCVTTLPNSKLCDAPITNSTRIERRFVKFTIGVTYDTPRAVLLHLLADIRTGLKASPSVHTETVEVNLKDFADSSIDIAIQFYLRTKDVTEARRIRSELDFLLMEIMEKNHVSFAFPSRSIYLETPLTLQKEETHNE